MSKHYLLFWRGLIVVSLVFGTGCLSWFAKYKYAEELLDIDSKTLTILSLNIVGDELTFTSNYQGCDFRFDLSNFEKAETDELKKITTPTKATVTFVREECSKMLEVIILEFNERELGTMSLFNDKNNNMANLYVFFAALCIAVSLLSLVMLKVSAWMIRKQAAVESER